MVLDSMITIIDLSPSWICLIDVKNMDDSSTLTLKHIVNNYNTDNIDINSNNCNINIYWGFMFNYRYIVQLWWRYNMIKWGCTAPKSMRWIIAKCQIVWPKVLEPIVILRSSDCYRQSGRSSADRVMLWHQPSCERQSFEHLKTNHMGVSINWDTPKWMLYKGKTH